MYLEFKRKELKIKMQCETPKNGVVRRGICISFDPLFVHSTDLDQAQKTLGDMRPLYFVAVGGIVVWLLVSSCSKMMATIPQFTGHHHISLG